MTTPTTSSKAGAVTFPTSRRTARSPRSNEKRLEIILSAARLFAEYGFQSIALEAIGQSVGITGPALYRYFTNKHALLAAIFERVQVRMVAAREESEGLSGQERLLFLVDFQLDLARSDQAYIRVYISEQRNLQPETRELINASYREYVKAWRDALHETRSDLSPAECREACVAVLWLINSVGMEVHDSGLRPHDNDLLRNLAVAALLKSEKPRRQAQSRRKPRAPGADEVPDMHAQPSTPED